MSATSRSAGEMRAVLATRPDVGPVVFGACLLAATARLRHHAGSEIATGQDPQGALQPRISEAVECFVEELRAVGEVTALAAAAIDKVEIEARRAFQGLDRPYSWAGLLHAATAFETRVAHNFSEAIDDAYFAAVDPFDGAQPGKFTTATLDLIGSAWASLASAGYQSLCPRQNHAS